MYQTLKNAFIGLDTYYQVASGETLRRIYLDSGASTLMMKPPNDAVQLMLNHYANTHTTVHTSAKITTSAFNWAHERVLEFVGANKDEYMCSFIGNGVTAAANRVAAGLAMLRPEKNVVLISSMEHHSNDLPHRQHTQIVEHIALTGSGQQSGQICLEHLETLLKTHQGKVSYVAITGVSNVTGIINPLQEIARLVHKYDAYLVVDGAQMAAHVPVYVTRDDVDFFLFSGHKVYAPGSPGVLVGRTSLINAMSPHQLGGGMVKTVSKWGYTLVDDLIEREQAGTPNITGAILLACALECLSRAGMEKVYQEELALVQWAIEQLNTCQTIFIYGDLNTSQRVASIVFNLDGIGHGLVAAILNDYFGIAVRNQCFCAHPYVQELLTEEFEALANETMDNETLEATVQDRRGMVRVSFGLYTTKGDIIALVKALKDIEKNIDFYRQHYIRHQDGSYSHKTFDSQAVQNFSLTALLDQLINSNMPQQDNT